MPSCQRRDISPEVCRRRDASLTLPPPREGLAVPDVRKCAGNKAVDRFRSQRQRRSRRSSPFFLRATTAAYVTRNIFHLTGLETGFIGALLHRFLFRRSTVESGTGKRAVHYGTRATPRPNVHGNPREMSRTRREFREWNFPSSLPREIAEITPPHARKSIRDWWN